MDAPILSILSNGNIKISEIKDGVIVPTEGGEYKFNNCAHKTDQEVEQTHRYCCGSHVLKGFLCNKLGIIPLKPEQCAACRDFSQK